MRDWSDGYLGLVTHPMLWIMLGLTATFFVVQWLVNPRPDNPDHQNRGYDTAGWMRKHYVAIVFAIGGAAMVAAVWFYVAEVGIAVTRLVDRLRVGAAEALEPEEAKNLAYGIAVLLGALVAAATIPFTLLRTWINERSTTAQEQGLITDRINTAVQGLGAEKEVNRLGRQVTLLFKETEAVSIEFEWKDEPLQLPPGATRGKNEKWENIAVTMPNLEVRIGAIYALERVAKKSDEDHVQIMEILCAYIRQNAPVDKLDVNPHLKKNTISGPHDLDEWTDSLEPPSLDIQTALTVLGRRTDHQLSLERVPESNGKVYRLDLKHTCLRKADLTGWNFSKAVFFESQLDGAYLNDTNFECANLIGCSMAGASAARANFNRSRLNSTDFTAAILDQASFLGTNHKLACFTGAQTEGAKF